MNQGIVWLAGCLLTVALVDGKTCKKVELESINSERNQVQMVELGKIDILRVREQLSEIECVKNVNFGLENENVIWVNGGCHAEFRVCDETPDELPEWQTRLKEVFPGKDVQTIIGRLKGVKKAKYGDSCTCKAWGFPHFQGFDQSQIHFRGSCEYYLAMTLGDFGQCSFAITAQNENGNGEGNIVRVNIFMFGKEISLLQNNRYFIDNVEQYGSKIVPNFFQVFQGSNRRQTFKSEECELEVSYNDNHEVQVVTSRRYSGHMTGLCGNCNDIEVDDYKLANGDYPPATAERNKLIGQSFQVTTLRDGAEEVCPEPTNTPECTQDGLADAMTICNMLIDTTESGPFRDCLPHMVHRARAIFDSCLSDVCGAIDSPAMAGRYKCRSLEILAEDCWEIGYYAHWRAAAGCDEECPANSLYTEFVPSCQASCTFSFATTHCKMDTHAGCLCDEGFKLEGTQCIPEDQCGCKDGRNYYPVDTEFKTRRCLFHHKCSTPPGADKPELTYDYGGPCPKKMKCELVDGHRECLCRFGFLWDEDTQSCGRHPINWPILRQRRIDRQREREMRQNTTCTCKALGDPHYKLFDKQWLHFQGACTYLLSGTITSGGHCDFKVMGKNEHRGGSVVASFTKELYIQARNVTIAIYQDGKVKVDNMERPIPTHLAKEDITIVPVGKLINVLLNGCHVEVTFNGRSTAVVKVPLSMGENVEGICGNCNGQKDDHKKADGTDMSDDPNKHREIGNSWAVPNPRGLREEADCAQDEPDLVCTPQQEEEASSARFCGRIINEEGPFAECLEKLPDSQRDEVNNLFSSCTIDVCTYRDDPDQLEQVLCNLNEAMALMCDAIGVGVIWRKPDFCPMTCMNHSQYTTLMSACQPTCMNPDPDEEECPFDGGEGCQCDPGYVLDNKQCIFEEKCGCTDPIHGYMPRGTIFLSADCTKKFKCEAGELGSILTANPTGHSGCHNKARCEPDAQHEPMCKCIEGYMGDGYQCTKIPDNPDPPYPPIDPPPPTGDECKCRASGDPHVDGFDDGRLEVYYPCKFTLSATKEFTNTCHFKAEIKNELHPRHLNQSFIRMVDLKLGNGRVIRLGNNKQVSVDGTPVNLMSSHNLPEATISLDGGFVHVVTECGVILSFDGQQKATLTVPSSFKPSLIGLCGNCNGDPHDDRMWNGLAPHEHPRGKVAGYNAIARQFMVWDDSDMPDTGVLCTPPVIQEQ